MQHESVQQYLYLLASRAAFLAGQKWDEIPRHSMINWKDTSDFSSVLHCDDISDQHSISYNGAEDLKALRLESLEIVLVCLLPKL